jgi:hypothetical protein
LQQADRRFPHTTPGTTLAILCHKDQHIKLKMRSQNLRKTEEVVPVLAKNLRKILGEKLINKKNVTFCEKKRKKLKIFPPPS